MEIHATSPVRMLVKGEPVSVSEKLTLRSISAVVAELSMGAALVHGADERVVGIVSERDVTAAIGEGAEPDEIWASDVMTESLVTVESGARVLDAALRMIDEDVRHVVIREGDDIVGVVSMRDIFRVLSEDVLTAL